jgi:glycosyltransferase involved in cell wall biosynthesis
VDNSSGDLETEHLAKKFGVRYTVEPIAGLSRARNRGLEESNSDILAYIDDDGDPDEDWLGLLLLPFADPQVAAVTGETIESHKDANECRQAPIRTLSNRDPLWFEAASFGGLGVGTSMALRKSACDVTPFFDVRLGRGTPVRIGEESRAFASLLGRGFKAVHVPAAIVVHPLGTRDISLEASSSVAYWLMLFLESPGHRLDLLRFLYRRLRRVPLSWQRNPQAPGEIINSGWGIHMRAVLHALHLFFRGWR